MSDTPIVDRMAFFADAKLGKTVFALLHKDAQELERMCEELAMCLSRASFIQAGMHAKADAALAKYQTMKEART